MKMEEQKRKYREIIAKSWEDENFKKRLFANPNKVLQEMGVKIPANQKVILHENTKTEVHISFPRKPEPLTMEELNNFVAAGLGGAAPWID